MCIGVGQESPDFGARLAPIQSHTQRGHIHYQIEGPANASALVLSNSLGTNLRCGMRRCRSAETFPLLRYDTRDMAKRSDSRPYSFEQLGRDVLALADETDIGAFFCDCRWR